MAATSIMAPNLLRRVVATADGLTSGVAGGRAGGYELTVPALDPLAAAAVGRLTFFEIELAAALRALLGHATKVTGRRAVPGGTASLVGENIGACPTSRERTHLGQWSHRGSSSPLRL